MTQSQIVKLQLQKQTENSQSENPNKVALDEINKALEDEIQKADCQFSNAFFTTHCNDLSKRQMTEGDINTDTFLAIHEEAVWLRYIEIALIKYLKNNDFADKDKQLEILKNFQSSRVYEKYFGKNGLKKQLNKYKRAFGGGAFEKILNAGVKQDDTFKIVDLKIANTTDLDLISQALNQESAKLETLTKSITITSAIQLQQLQQAILMADPKTTAMIMHTRQGQACLAAMENIYKKQACEVGLWIITASCVTTIGVLLMPQLTIALGISVPMLIITKMIIQAIGLVVSTEMTKQLTQYFDEALQPTDGLSQTKTEAINSIKIDNEQSKELQNALQKLPDKIISIDAKNQEQIKNGSKKHKQLQST